MNGRQWHDILNTSLPPPAGYNYMAINSNLSSNVGSPKPFLYELLSLVASVSPGVRLRTKAGMLMCSLACEGTYSAQQTFSQITQDRGRAGGIGPGYVLALRQHLGKVSLSRKKTWPLGFSWHLASHCPPLASTAKARPPSTGNKWETSIIRGATCEGPNPSLSVWLWWSHTETQWEHTGPPNQLQSPTLCSSLIATTKHLQ